MKLTLLIICLIPYVCFCQDPSTFLKEMRQIAELEKQSAAAYFSSKETQTASSANFDVYHYRCQWQVNPYVRYITGKVTPSFVMTSTGNAIVLDLSTQLTVDSVVYHNNKISFQHQSPDALAITFPANIPQGTKDSVSIFYQGVPKLEGFGSFAQNYHLDVPIIWTLSQPYGSKDWWPCKNGLTDKADSIDIFITHPAAFIASSNGLDVSRNVVDTMATTHFHHRYPIASYLVAMAVTNYWVWDDTVTVNNKNYRFMTYAYPEAVGYYSGQAIYAKNAFRTFTKLFGEYPFAAEKYAQTQFGWPGGMEHQTNSFIRNNSPAISAHELGHQWFGDRITCGSWAHIWLNEGFAQYASGLYTAEHHPIQYYLGFIRETLFNSCMEPGGSVYVRDTTDVSKIFDGRLIYNKGAFVVHMLRGVLGDSLFYKGVRQYLSDPTVSYGFATTEDLQRNLEQVSGRNLNTFFQKWIYGEGYANYQAEWSQNNNLWVKLKLNQTTSHPSVSFYDMPVQLEFRSATKKKLVTVEHQYNGQEFSIQLDFVPDTVVIDPDLWVLAKDRTSKKIATSTTPDVIQLYPNPAPRNALLTWQNPTGNKLSIRLLNAAGQLLYRKEITVTGRDESISIPLEHRPKGMYVLDIRNDKGLMQIKKILH
jgi:aminopeptidase N